LTTQVALLFPCEGEWTEADYLSLPETNRIVELSEGRLVIPDMPSFSHQYAVGELFAALRTFVRAGKLGTVAMAPLRIRLWAGKFREPDVVFLSRAHQDRRGDRYWGVPDLVMEVISRGERGKWRRSGDRRPVFSPFLRRFSPSPHKFAEYARAGIAEYWLVSPHERSIEVYALREGAYRLLGKWGMSEIARSEILPGFEFAVSAIVVEEEAGEEA
jgi:Uma2 family endonuclease